MPIDVGESEMDKLKIEYFKTDELIPYANNPRNNDEAVDYVANSIKEFGFKVPCVIDSEKNVVCGHTRLKAAKKLGIKEIPCIIADDLTEEQIDAFRLANNKTSEIATWDFEKLEIELESISGIDMSKFDFNIGEGFNLDDIEGVNGYDVNNDDREYFTAAFTFPTAQKEQIMKYLRKHKQAITEEIIQKASE